jgi:hypothetical protein
MNNSKIKPADQVELESLAISNGPNIFLRTGFKVVAVVRQSSNISFCALVASTALLFSRKLHKFVWGRDVNIVGLAVTAQEKELARFSIRNASVNQLDWLAHPCQLIWVLDCSACVWNQGHWLWYWLGGWCLCCSDVLFLEPCGGGGGGGCGGSGLGRSTELTDPGRVTVTFTIGLVARCLSVVIAVFRVTQLKFALGSGESFLTLACTLPVVAGGCALAVAIPRISAWLSFAGLANPAFIARTIAIRANAGDVAIVAAILLFCAQLLFALVSDVTFVARAAASACTVSSRISMGRAVLSSSAHLQFTPFSHPSLITLAGAVESLLQYRIKLFGLG